MLIVLRFVQWNSCFGSVNVRKTVMYVGSPHFCVMRVSFRKFEILTTTRNEGFGILQSWILCSGNRTSDNCVIKYERLQQASHRTTHLDSMHVLQAFENSSRNPQMLSSKYLNCRYVYMYNMYIYIYIYMYNSPNRGGTTRRGSCLRSIELPLKSRTAGSHLLA